MIFLPWREVGFQSISLQYAPCLYFDLTVWRRHLNSCSLWSSQHPSFSRAVIVLTSIYFRSSRISTFIILRYVRFYYDWQTVILILFDLFLTFYKLQSELLRLNVAFDKQLWILLNVACLWRPWNCYHLFCLKVRTRVDIMFKWILHSSLFFACHRCLDSSCPFDQLFWLSRGVFF